MPESSLSQTSFLRDVTHQVDISFFGWSNCSFHSHLELGRKYQEISKGITLVPHVFIPAPTVKAGLLHPADQVNYLFIDSLLFRSQEQGVKNAKAVSVAYSSDMIMHVSYQEYNPSKTRTFKHAAPRVRRMEGTIPSSRSLGLITGTNLALTHWLSNS